MSRFEIYLSKNDLEHIANGYTLADAKVQTMLVGKTPTKQEETGQGITKEQFRKMGYQSRNELFQTNPELYNQLKG